MQKYLSNIGRAQVSIIGIGNIIINLVSSKALSFLFFDENLFQNVRSHSLVCAV